MTDTDKTLEQPTEPQHAEQSKFQSFKDNHPKTTKVAGATVAVLAVVGTVALLKGRKKDQPTEQEPEPTEVYSESDPDHTMATES